MKLMIRLMLAQNFSGQNFSTLKFPLFAFRFCCKEIIHKIGFYTLHFPLPLLNMFRQV